MNKLMYVKKKQMLWSQQASVLGQPFQDPQYSCAYEITHKKGDCFPQKSGQTTEQPNTQKEAA